MMGLFAERAFDVRPAQNARHVSAKPEKRQITRNRTSYSCQTCRRRKIKCDKQHPICSSCLKTNEECVYGRSELEAPNTNGNANDASLQGAKRSRSPVSNGRHSPPALHRAPSNLEAVEEQLQRLTAMIEGMRRDSGSVVRLGGPLTPISTRSNRDSEEDCQNRRRSSKSPTYPQQILSDETPQLTRPLSELNIAKHDNEPMYGTRDTFWLTIAEEVEQLHAMMRGVRPLGPQPHADAGQGACTGHSDTHQQQTPSTGKNSHSDPISFRRMANSTEPSTVTDECQVCSENSCDKSMLLPTANSTRLGASTKLDLTAGIPTEAQSNVLFRTFLTSVYPVLAYIPIRQAFKKHQAFWDWVRSHGKRPGHETESADINFMPLLNTIWYSGVLSLSSRGFRTWFPSKTRAGMAAHFHDQVIRYLSLLSFPSNSQMHLIGCLIALQSIPNAEEDPIQSSAYINLLVRLAQTAGIHREPALFGVAPYEAEMRRRMWWQIVQLDVSFASSSGYPTFMSDDLADTRPISEVHELYVGSPEEQEYLNVVASGHKELPMLPDPLSGQEFVVSIFHLVAKASHTVAVTIRKIIHMHMSTETITKATIQWMNNIIADVEEDVKEIINRIPTKGMPELGFAPDDNTLRNWPILESDPAVGDALTETEYAYYVGLAGESMPSKLAQYHRQKLCAFNKWARITLSLMCDKMHCAAYAPFLKNAKSKLWTAARQCALRHCTSFLRKFISLASDPGLESFRWCWPGTHQPMHAAMILLIDVYERHDSIEAPRCRALIDKIFALADPAEGIVGGENGVSTQRPLREGGSEAWDLLRDLRNLAWRKARLDPNVLWTEKDQVEVGVAKPLTTEQRLVQSLREDTLQPDDEKESPPNAQPVMDSDPGLQYAMEMARKELHDFKPSDPEQKPTTVNPSDVRSPMEHGTRRLLRLPRQQLMPFPLHGHEKAKCPGNHDYSNSSNDDGTVAAEVEAIRIDEMIKQARATLPNGENGSSGGQHDATQLERLPNEFGSHTHMNRGIHSDTSAATLWSPDSTPQVLKDLADMNGVAPQAASASNDLQANEVQDSDMSDSFDWERWDAVFGQYSGFADFMEDITWEEPHGR